MLNVFYLFIYFIYSSYLKKLLFNTLSLTDYSFNFKLKYNDFSQKVCWKALKPNFANLQKVFETLRDNLSKSIYTVMIMLK